MLSHSSSSTLPLTVISGEPRVHDLALAERLGFDQPRDIRKLIKRNEAKLLSFGVCATVAQTSGELGGRPTAAFYLNQKQAIFVCMKSETDRAFDVQVEIVRVFDAYLNGDLKSDATIASQPRLHFELRGALRAFDLAKDAWSKQIAANQIKVLCGHLGIPVPDFALIGKPIEQYQLEV